MFIFVPLCFILFPVSLFSSFTQMVFISFFIEMLKCIEVDIRRCKTISEMKKRKDLKTSNISVHELAMQMCQQDEEAVKTSSQQWSMVGEVSSVALACAASGPGALTKIPNLKKNNFLVGQSVVNNVRGHQPPDGAGRCWWCSRTMTQTMEVNPPQNHSPVSPDLNPSEMLKNKLREAGHTRHSSHVLAEAFLDRMIQNSARIGSVTC